MIRAKNYETVSKFVKVMTKILWPLFFPDTVYKWGKSKRTMFAKPWYRVLADVWTHHPRSIYNV